MPKSLIILSNKSSGSSACQALLARYAHVKHVDKTRHFENETLYCTKAASVLQKTQLNMLDSEVPIDHRKARRDLIMLLRDTLGEEYAPPEDDQSLIFDGWRRLCYRYSPVFLEKSPHHLYQWSALELICQCIAQLSREIDFLVIGLVRNPMDTLYSAFRRWKTPPHKLQYEWLIAYSNLLKLTEILKEKLVIIRYEDIIASTTYLKPIFDFCDIDADTVPSAYLHTSAISKWKQDKKFGFCLADEVIDLANRYGYSKEEIYHKSYPLWPLYWSTSRGMSKILNIGKMFYTQLAFHNK
jgi:hypothetical protein